MTAKFEHDAHRIVRGERHFYLGCDRRGRHHHYDRAYGRTHRTEPGGRIYVFEESGRLAHIQPLGVKQTAAGQRLETVADWIRYVDARACGWERRVFVTTADIFG